jgi:transcriptional regulator with XRE-family HTH domain/Zn-dependent peptidase ImmA (M78 family)
MRDDSTIKLIFGFKVAYLRQQKDLSFQQLRELTGLSLSYLHDIEKGKKYPKTDKIMALADALDVDYEYLVSLQATKKVQPVIDLLNSDFLRIFPLDMFGLPPAKLLELFVNTPYKVNAFISTIIKMVRNYHIQGEDFYRAALRSYQDMNDNYFGEIEENVGKLKEERGVLQDTKVTTVLLENILQDKFGIKINRTYLPEQKTLRKIRSYYIKKGKKLLLNEGLTSAQENFLLAKEIGFQQLDLKKRSYETRMVEVDSFEKLLSNFQASYFSVAFLIDEREIVKDMKLMGSWIKWDGERFLKFLDKYNVTPEMFIQRMANIFPKHFNINDLFFFRMFGGADLKTYRMTKEVHLSQLHHPHANNLEEHYCRRWVAINLIRRLKAVQHLSKEAHPIADAQISNYWNTDQSYFSMCIAKADKESPKESVSVTIGFLVTNELRQFFRFLRDPNLRIKEVHTTCERCGIADCMARAAPPIAIEQENEKQEVANLLKTIKRKGI